MAKHTQGKFMSKGLRISCAKTGKLPNIIDTKQLKHIKSNTEGVKAYEKAERERARLLDKWNGSQMMETVFIKGKKVRQAARIPTAHKLAFD